MSKGARLRCLSNMQSAGLTMALKGLLINRYLFRAFISHLPGVTRKKLHICLVLFRVQISVCAISL